MGPYSFIETITEFTLQHGPTLQPGRPLRMPVKFPLASRRRPGPAVIGSLLGK